jgi:hypothetical protein
MIDAGALGGCTPGCEIGPLSKSLSAPGPLGEACEAAWEGPRTASIREGPAVHSRSSCMAVSPVGRPAVLSAFGPVGGATARPDGMLALGAVGTIGAVLAGAAETTGSAGDGAGAVRVDAAGATGFGGGNETVVGLASGTGALHTLDPNAGTAAGGDEGRGAYLSLEASARLASKASSFPGSRRESFWPVGSMASDERREYKSACDPIRSEGDTWWDECGVGPVGVPGM